MLRLLRAGVEQKLAMTVPVAVLAEWWRGRTDVREAILAAMLVEPMDERLGRAAGAAIAAVKGATPIDAIVMASAARRDDVVLTSDIEDMTRLATHFRSVRVLGV